MATTTIDSRLIPTVQYTTPTTGQTVTASISGNVTLFIDPVGTLVALTVALNPSPTDGDMLTIATSQAITGITISGGTVISTLTTMALGAFATYQYSGNASKWFRIG